MAMIHAMVPEFHPVGLALPPQILSLDETLVLYIITSVSTCLQHTLDAMLERAGVASNLKDSDLKGPTEVRERERGREGGGRRERLCIKIDV